MAGPHPSKIRLNRMTAGFRSDHPGPVAGSRNLLKGPPLPSPRLLRRRGSDLRPARVFAAAARLIFLVLILFGSILGARAALQFDVFLGYDGVIPEATWFPVVCEIKNDGPSLNGVIELNGGSLNQGQVQKVEVELPTGTLKRLVIPVFSATRVFN